MDRRKILVADDQPTLRRLVRKHLLGRGFEVVEASDGEEALRKVAEFHPDLLVLDVMMPRMDGFQVLERLQAVPGTMNIPVLFLTAKSAESDRVQGLSLGAHDYVSKPFSLNELSLRIDRLLETKARIDKLVEYGQRDEVTGLPRRSYFEMSLKERINQHGSKLGMVFVVFEGLDNVTSETGLEGVDEAMARAAEVLQKHSEKDAEPFWVGPTHGAVLQWKTDPARLSALERTLRSELESSLCQGRDRPKITVTTTKGIYEPGESPERFVKRVTGMSSFESRKSSSKFSESSDLNDLGSSVKGAVLPKSGEKSEIETANERSSGEGAEDGKGAKVIRFPTERRHSPLA